MLAGLAFGASLPARVAESSRYRDAVRAGEAETVAATVTRVWVGRGRGSDRYVELRLVDGTSRRVELYDVEAWETLESGDEVTATRWDGALARLHEPGEAPAETTASPLEQQATTAKLGLLLVPWGGFGLWVAARLRRASGSWRAKAHLPTGKPSRGARGCVVGGAAAGATFVVFGLGAGMYDLGYVVWVPLSGAAFGAICGLLLWAVLRAIRSLRSPSGDDALRRRRRDDRDDDHDDDDHDDDD